MASRDNPPFDSWNIAHYQAGWDMGMRHATIGDPNDFSDERCKPLENERDTMAHALDSRMPFGSAAFHGGYESGYESVLPANFFNQEGR